MEYAAPGKDFRVRLLETEGALGGIWTVGCLPHIIELDKDGLLRELIERLKREGAGPGRGEEAREHIVTDDAPQLCDFAVETFKVVLDKMAAEAGVSVRLYTRVCAVYRDANNRVETVVTESKSGREAWRAKVFIDCTGDGDLAALAGCGYEIGQPHTGLCQPMSMMALLAGAGRADEPPFNIHKWGKNKDWILAEMRRGKHEPSYGRPSMFLVRDGYIIMMANHEYGYRRPDAQILMRFSGQRPGPLLAQGPRPWVCNRKTNGGLKARSNVLRRRCFHWCGLSAREQPCT